MKNVFLGALALLVTNAAVADHIAELNFNYGSSSESVSENGYSLDVDSRVLDMGATFYLPSAVAKGPILEQGFLSKSSMLFVGNTINQTEWTFGGNAASWEGGKDHDRITSAGGYAVVNNWIVGGNYSGYYAGEDGLVASTQSLLGGLYVADAAAITLSLGRAKYEDCDDCDSDSLAGLQYHQVFNVSDIMSYALSASYTKIADTKMFGAEGVVYFTPKTGVKLNLERTANGDYSATDIGIAAHYFINPMVGFHFGLTQSETESIKDDKVTVIDVGVQVNI